MAAGWREGSIVVLQGPADEVEDVEVGRSKGVKIEGTGRLAQLVRYLSQDSAWLAVTLEGVAVRVPVGGFRAPAPREVPAQLELVLGPRSDEAIFAHAVMQALTHKGYCVTQAIVPKDAMLQMHEATSQLQFSRVPAQFEPYYLGRDSRERMVLVDFDSPDVPRAVADSPLAAQDRQLGSLCTALTAGLEVELGIRVTSRTNMMVRQTFADDEDEAAFPAPASTTDAEKESFLSLMKRKRVCAMQFLGPLTGRLVLIPKGDEEDAEERQIEAAPGTMVVFLTERYSYSYTCAEGRSTALQTWFLGQRPEFQMGEIGGDLDLLAGKAEGAQQPKGETVAVTGISTFLGGDSKDYASFWLMFAKAGGDTFVKIPLTRWDTEIYCLADDMQLAMISQRSYTKHMGFVDGIELFDAKFFGISQTEAVAMDPNQRKTLECVYEALAMGGHDLKTLQRNPANIGVFVGTSGSEWDMVQHATDAAGCGGHDAILSNRCNFSLNLKGSSQTINTACSAGLVAMHTGKLHLKYKDFDPLEAVVATGINLAYAPGPFIGCCSGGMLSYKGRSFTFDISADGYGRGEGSSGVYMKLSELDAQAFALVAGSQSNQDGRSASITAPNGPSQEKCIKAAFREAALKPQEVDCFECHGTGTALGDPIEVGAFRRIYNATQRSHSLLVTTSKTNLGHLEGGAGMAGFIKCCLQVMRAEGAPNLHLRELNAHLDVEGFPAQFITECLCCQYDSAYSGVSSFGFGGTNAHSMSYGRNTVTSRGISQRGVSYYRSKMREKLAAAPPPEIMMLSEDPEDWETNGMPVSEDKIGKVFQVEVLDGGRAIWREVVAVPPAFLGDRFSVSGTFNDWSFHPMVADGAVPHLYAAEVTVGPTGEELFHIVANEDRGLVYYPRDTPRCTVKVEPIIGPEDVDVNEECCWAIVANPGVRYRIEFHCAPHAISVNWLRIRDSLAR